MEISIRMPKVWQQIIETDKSYIGIPSGRVSGKTKNSVLLALFLMLENPYTDIVITRASYGSMGDSSFAEFEAAIDDLPEELKGQFTLKKVPLRVERVNDSGTIYFIGAGGYNKDRTKGLKTKHKVKSVIIEEAQEFKDKESYDQFMASVRRNLEDDAKIILLFNPPAIKVHWINVFIEQKQYDKDWLIVKTSWLDILDFLNDYDVKEILKCRKLEPDYYRWLYMGEATGGFGLVYPMFRESKHIITIEEWSLFYEKTMVRPVACVIGVDGAVNNDASVCVPIIILNNGQSVIGNIFYHNPKENAVIGYHQLVQDYISRWFKDLQMMFRLGSLEERMMNPRTNLLPIMFCCDSAAPDLIQELKFFFSNRASVYPIKKKAITEMVGICQSTIANNNMVIIDYHGYYNYYFNKWIKTDTNILAAQIESLIWNEQQTNYDPIVPNDISDAWTYGNIFWYSNQENIQYFNILKMNNVKNTLISDIIVK